MLGKEARAFNKEFFQWCLPIIRSYEGPEPTGNVLEFLEKLLTQNNEQINEFRGQTKLSEGVGLSLKQYEVPFIQSKLQEISIFTND